MNLGAFYSQSVTSKSPPRRPFLPFLFIFPFLMAFDSTSNNADSAPPMMCANPEPITRWNQLTNAERDALDDGDIATNVAAFHTGLCNGGGGAITMNIAVTGAPHSGNSLIVNNDVPSLWGNQSFRNRRSETGDSGNRYCFEFSEPVAVDINSEEHKLFHDHEQIWVEASFGGSPVDLIGSLNGNSGTAVVNNSGTPNLHFDAADHESYGGWWQASSNGVAVDVVCVEYYTTTDAVGENGEEPFSLAICAPDRCLTDGQYDLTFLAETICTNQAASGVPGNMNVTFRLTAINNGTEDLSNIQIFDDLDERFPVGAFFGAIDIVFAPTNTLVSPPTLNANFDGYTSKNLFASPSGTLSPGETLAVDFTLELDANAFSQIIQHTNQAYFSAIDGSGNFISGTSDAGAGNPGDTGGEVDGLLVQIPAINLIMNALDYGAFPACDANGEVEVTLQMRMRNTGNAALDNLNLFADFQSMLGDAFVDIVAPPSVFQSIASTTPSLNPDYDGTSSNDNIFDGISGLLDSDQWVSIHVRLRLDPNALGAPMNQLIQTSMAARGLDVNADPLPGCHDDDYMWAFDDSDAGLVEESINDSYIGHVDNHDDPLPLILANAGLSKELVSFLPASSQTPGNVDARFRLRLRNTGNTELTNIELNDDVSAQLGDAFISVVQAPQIIASTASILPSIGASPSNIFQGGGQVTTNQEIIVDYVIEINPDATIGTPLTNQAEVNFASLDEEGAPTTGSTLSDGGSDPEGNNPGTPGDSGCTNDPTLIYLPGLMIAQEIVGVDYASSGTSGNFDAIVQVVVENVGNVDLDEFTLLQNLSNPAQLGSTFVEMVEAPSILPVGAHGTMTTATTSPTPNASYNGNGDLLLPAGSGLLTPGETFVVQYRIEVAPEANGAPNIPKLQVEGFAVGNGPSGNDITVTDISDAGHTPQSTNPGRLGDSGGSNDPTPLTDCGVEIGSLTCNNSIQVSMNQDCLAAITPGMVLEGEFWYCEQDDLLPLGAYYEIFMITDPFGAIVDDAVPGTPNILEIDGSYVGQVLTVKVNDVVNNNSCWGTLTLEDKLGPVFDCPSPIEIECFEDLSAVAAPVATDNCDPDPTVSFVAQHIIDNDICDDGLYKVRRTYTASDQYGNQAPNQCVFEIHLTRPDVTFPQDINWFCDQYANYPNIIQPNPLHPIVKDIDNTPPDIDVSPTLPGTVLSETGSGIVNNSGGVCSYHVSNSDQTLAACGNTFKIIRTWSVIDWCTGQVITQGANGEDNVQTIQIIDATAPTLSVSNFTVSATVPGSQHQTCRSQGLLPPLDSFNDNCQPNSELNVQIVTSIGEAEYINGVDGKQGGLIPAPGLTIGVHDIIYKVTDACGNVDSVVVQATVVDDITPTAVCDELTEANLTTNGIATVLAETFDDGSHDNCCLIGDFQVRRMIDPCDDGQDDTVFGPSVTFCCADVDAGPQMVVFRVFDCAGNFNDCMVEVVVNDKQEPLLLSCPGSARITCNEYGDNFETQLANLAGDPAAQNNLFDAGFGTAIFQDNCEFTLTESVTVNLDQCLEGNLIRRWQATDPGGLTSPFCTQNIFVDHVSNWVVEFAPDVSISCGQTVPEFVEPEIFFEDCEMVGESYEDVTSTVVQDACFKIERTWVIINWCVLGDLTDEEYAEMPESQLGLAFPDCDLDGDGDCDDRTFRDSWGNGVYPDASIATQNFGPDTDIDSDPWDGYITYTQTIKATDTVDPVFIAGCGTLPEVCIEDNTCVAAVILTEPTVDDCSPMVSISASSDLGNGFGPFLNVSPGTYNVTFTAMDNCNNQASCQATVTVRDCKAPSPLCKPGLIVGIMGTTPPMITVVADSLNDGSSDNCPGDLIFSFSSDTTHTIDSFFCFNLGDNDVEIWVTDQAGNQDLCTTTITVQDAMNNCNDDPLVASLAGVIDTELGEPVEGVNISVNGQFTGNQMTPITGDFNFEDIPVGNDLTITPTLDDEPLNGVTTFDLVIISQHILGVSGLDSPYKMIAADANNSGSITTFDLLQIRKLILYIDDEFPNNSSWRFIDKNYIFPNASDPWSTPFPEVININDIPSDVLDADFVAIKIGDVNGSASTNLYGSTEDRSTNETFMLNAEERNLTRGEKFNLSLSAKDVEVNGFQFTLQFDPTKLEFLTVENAQLEAKNFGYTFIEEGYLTVSWNGDLTDASSLAELRFRALENFRLGNAIQINSRYTVAEAYQRSGSLMDVDIQFVDGDVAGSFELYQNVPNPFSDATLISFHLPRASMATLTISDTQGRTVRTVTDLYEAGYNEIELGKDQLPSNGIFYYRLETPTDSDTKTMILLK